MKESLVTHPEQKVMGFPWPVSRHPVISMIEVDSDLGAAQEGASSEVERWRQLALSLQKTQLDLGRRTFDLNCQIAHRKSQARPIGFGGPSSSDPYPHAKSIDAIYRILNDTSHSVAEALNANTFPIVLAGDHSTAAGTIAGIKQAFPQCRLGVVWIDAHADLHSPYTTPSGNLHGMPVAIATGLNHLDQQTNILDPATANLWEKCKALGGSQAANLNPCDLVYVAVRDTEPAEDAVIEQYQIPVLRTDFVRQIGPDQAAQWCLDYLEDVDLIYVSFDVDSLDSSICMGTGTPAEGGLHLNEARRLNAALLQDQRVCCWEMCELNPTLDTLNTMASISREMGETVLQGVAGRLASSRFGGWQQTDLHALHR